MPKKIPKILTINPGTRYLGIAVFEGQELLDWRVKVIKGKWSKDKQHKTLVIVRTLIGRYQPDILAIKKLHQSRSSGNLNQLVSRIKQHSKRKGLKVYQYSIKELEAFFFGEVKANRNKLAEILASKYTFLRHELNKENANKNSYHIRVFEAVALGAVCSHQLEKH